MVVTDSDKINLVAGRQSLCLLLRDRYFYLVFGIGRVCVATVLFFIHASTLLVLNHTLLPVLFFPFFSQLHGLCVVNLDKGPSPYFSLSSMLFGCSELFLPLSSVPSPTEFVLLYTRNERYKK